MEVSALPHKGGGALTNVETATSQKTRKRTPSTCSLCLPDGGLKGVGSQIFSSSTRFTSWELRWGCWPRNGMARCGHHLLSDPHIAGGPAAAGVQTLVPLLMHMHFFHVSEYLTEVPVRIRVAPSIMQSARMCVEQVESGMYVQLGHVCEMRRANLCCCSEVVTPLLPGHPNNWIGNC